MHHRWPDMIYEIGSMKSFEAIHIILMFFGAPDCFVAIGDKKVRTFSWIGSMLENDKESQLHR